MTRAGHPAVARLQQFGIYPACRVRLKYRHCGHRLPLMPYQVLNANELYKRGGLDYGSTTHQERLQAALEQQKEAGMDLVAIDNVQDDNPLYVFKHETD